MSYLPLEARVAQLASARPSVWKVSGSFLVTSHPCLDFSLLSVALNTHKKGSFDRERGGRMSALSPSVLSVSYEYCYKLPILNIAALPFYLLFSRATTKKIQQSEQWKTQKKTPSEASTTFHQWILTRWRKTRSRKWLWVRYALCIMWFELALC